MRAVLGHGLSPRKPGSVSRFSPSPSVHPKGCTPECQLDQSDNDDCAEDNELSENKLWSVGRANFDYYAPRAHRNVNDVLSTDCALARWRAGVLLRRGAQIAVSHDDPPRIEISHEQMKG